MAGPWSNPNRLAQNVSSIWSVSTDGTNADGTPFVQSFAISATVTSPQVGVIFPNGTAVYQYLGCYFDAAVRQFSNQLSYNANQTANNENGQCQKDCYALGYTFAATEYSGTFNHYPLPFGSLAGNRFSLPYLKTSSKTAC